MRSLLIMGFGVGIFMVSSLVMYLVWIRFEELSDIARGVVSLFSFIFAFSGTTFLFWKMVERLSVVEALG